MPALSVIKEANTTIGPQLKNLVAVIVGATSGIGEHTAYTIAKYTKSPTIYIVGRNKESGTRVIENLKTLNSDEGSKYLFYSHDLTLISEAENFSKTVLENESKVNILFLSCGSLSLTQSISIEGIDKKMAVNYFSRWKIVESLMPLLQKASELKETSRVVSVLGSRENSPAFVHPEDIGLKTHYSLFNAAKHNSMFNSLATLNFARLYPDTSFTHAFPGFVNTGFGREIPWYIRVVAMPLAKCFATPEEQSGEKFLYVSATGDEFKKGAHIINGSCDPTFKKANQSGYLWKEENQKAAWEFTLEKYKEAIAALSSSKNGISTSAGGE